MDVLFKKDWRGRDGIFSQTTLLKERKKHDDHSDDHSDDQHADHDDDHLDDPLPILDSFEPRAVEPACLQPTPAHHQK